jgi:predicted membrane protein
MKLRPMVISAAMAALALVLPPAFHMVGLGSKFLPLLLPLLLNGFLVPPCWALFTGLITPLISTLATGMPPLYPPITAVVALEGATLGAVAAVIYRGKRQRLWPALIAAVVAGRVMALASSWILARYFGLPPALASTAMLIQGAPGVVLQLLVVPLVVRALGSRRGILFS